MLTYFHSIWDGLAGVAGLVLFIPASAGLVWLHRQGKATTTAVLAVLVTAMCWSLLEPLGDTLYRRVTLLGSFTAFDGSFSPLQAMQNAALFVPFGAVVACHPVAREREYRIAALGGLGLGFVVETGQLLAIPGRNADLSDLTMNVVGAVVGAVWAMLAWRTLSSFRARSEREAAPAREICNGAADRRVAAADGE